MIWFKNSALIFASLCLVHCRTPDRQCTHKKVSVSPTNQSVKKQHPTSQRSPNKRRHSPPVKRPKTDFVSVYTLPQKILNDWNTFRHSFLRKAYLPCLRKYRIRRCCKPGCHEGVTSQLQITISSTGYLKSWTHQKPVVSEPVSEQRAVPRHRVIQAEMCYLRHLPTLRFPKSLRNRKLQILLGSTLGC